MHYCSLFLSTWLPDLSNFWNTSINPVQLGITDLLLEQIYILNKWLSPLRLNCLSYGRPFLSFYLKV